MGHVEDARDALQYIYPALFPSLIEARTLSQPIPPPPREIVVAARGFGVRWLREGGGGGGGGWVWLSGEPMGAHHTASLGADGLARRAE